MGGHVTAAAGRLLGHDADLLRRILRHPQRVRRRENPARSHDLDGVRAAAQPLAGRPAQCVNPVHHLRHMTPAETAPELRRPRIAVASGLTQRGPAEQVPRRRRQPLPDRLGQPRVPAARIPDRGEPAPQRPSQPPRPGQGQVTQRTGLDLHQAEASAVSVKVRVDQARHDRTATAVNDPVARLRPLADLDDRARRHPDAAFPQPSRHAVEDHRVGESRGLLGHSHLTSDGAPMVTHDIFTRSSVSVGYWPSGTAGRAVRCGPRRSRAAPSSRRTLARCFLP